MTSTDNLKVEEKVDLEKNIKIFEQKTNISFNDFYNKYLNKLVYYNYKIVKDLQQAEDLAQDAIIRAVECIDGYDSEKSKFSTWLFSISKNESLQLIKKKHIKNKVSLDQVVDDEGSTLLDYMYDDTEKTKTDLQITELNHTKGEILLNYIPFLKEPYRNILEMCDIHKYSYRKITIELKEYKKTNVNLADESYVNDNGFIDITMVDPEIKKVREVAKYVDIEKIVDHYGNDISYDVLEYDKDGLICKIRVLVETNRIYIHGNMPFNLSTLKSRIRCARITLQNMVDKKFKELEVQYLELN